MDKERAKKIAQMYEWARAIILLGLLILLLLLPLKLSAKEKERSPYIPEVHGILRGKFEYQPAMKAGRFEVRNARLSVSGKIPLRAEYKLEVDLCDESAIKMKDAWVRITPWRTLRISIGQQRMPFSIDAHRNPSAQFFANRSFIAKQVGDMRDVGAMIGYDFLLRKPNDTDEGFIPKLIIDAGIFNGSNLDNQKKAWFRHPGYSARIVCLPIEGLALIPSVQHQQIAERRAAYTSVDGGIFYHAKGWHAEVEYLRKFYANHAFSDCNAVDVMLIYRYTLPEKVRFLEAIYFLGRYDWMQDHSSGKDGFVQDEEGKDTDRLVRTDAERHRMTAGLTFSIRSRYVPTDIRLNYEKYFYPHDGAKESEQDKLVAEVMMKF